MCHSLNEAAEERGRGPLPVEAVSSAWSAQVSRVGRGRVVWAELPYGNNLPRGPRFPYGLENPR